jgi:hypothetical protein
MISMGNEEKYYELIATVVTENADNHGVLEFNKLFNSNPAFKELFNSLSNLCIIHHKKVSPVFDTQKAFEQLKERLQK